MATTFEAQVEIPESGELPFYKMTAVPPRYALINQLLDGVLPNAPVEESCDKPPQNQRLRLGQDGSFEIYPSFTTIERSGAEPFNAKQLLGLVSERLAAAIVPRDAAGTTTTRNEGRVLSFATRSVTDSTEAAIKPEKALLYVCARRHMGDLPIEGPGSRIMVAVDRNGRVQGAVYDWKEPVKEGALMPPSVESVGSQIEAQLENMKAVHGVRVKRVELVYFDNGRLLLPAYRYVAEFGQHCESYGPAQTVVGYVPFLKSPAEPGVEVVDPAGPVIGLPQLSVGRYRARELSAGWKESSESFRDALASAEGGHRWRDVPEQEAEPKHFTDAKDEHVNSVDVALVEAHGLEMGFVTRGEDREAIYIEQDISPKHGYGFAANGKLKHLILHACSAVATEANFTGWARAWAPIFRGLGSVVGYRSVMFVRDGAPASFAPSLASGAPVIAAWFNAVASLNIYARDSSIMLRCSGNRALGRPAAVCAAGFSGLTAEEEGPAEAKKLESWWLEDEVVTVTCDDCPEEGGPGSVPKRKKKRGG